jgi:hypothetical protein
MRETIGHIPEVCPPKDAELRVDGLSLLFFDYYTINAGATIDLSRAERIVTKNDYLSLFDLGTKEAEAQRMYRCKPIPLPPVDLKQAGDASGTARLLFRVFDESFVVAITVINVDCSKLGQLLDENAPILRVKRPLMTDDILQLIGELNQPNTTLFENLRETRRRAVEEIFGRGVVNPHAENRSRKNVGIQIWSIETPTSMRSGIQLSEHFGWEITALLECGSDLILDERAWRDRRPDQVEALLGKGTDILGDHRALIHRSVCLEISRVRVTSLRPRSRDRLFAFGFDSTSLYLSCILAGQECALIEISDQLSEMMKRLHASVEEHPDDAVTIRTLQAELIRVRLALNSALDSVFWISSRMREGRHVDFFRDAMTSWGLDAIRSEVDQKLRALSEVIQQSLQLSEAIARNRVE